MIDLEDQLRESLATYAASITPTAMADGPVADEFARVTTIASPRPSWQPALAAAAVVILIVGGLTALVRRSPDPTSLSAPATTTLSAGTWTAVPQAPLSARRFPSVVWTGTEFIVWGGERNNVGFNDGAAFNPATNVWRTLAANERAQPGATAVWAGDRMIVLAGDGGEAYDPVTDTWTSLPPLPVDYGSGITDTVWTGSELLGVGHERSASGSGGVSTLRVWSLDATRSTWTATAPQQLAPELGVAGRFMNQPDQFGTINPIATDEGFVVWDGANAGWQYSTTAGWRQLPTLATFDGRPIRESAVVWHAGQLQAVISVGPRYGDDPDRIDIAWLDGQRWSPSRSIADGGLALSQLRSVGSSIMALGANFRWATQAPILIDPESAVAAQTMPFPIGATFDQGAAWSGRSLFVWGGQRPTYSEVEQSTDDTSTVSNEGAMWTP